LKILVIDSTGLSDITDRYRHYFAPHIKLIGHEPSKGYKKTASGPHGYQCGYYAGVLLNLLPDEEHELHFARIFDQDGGWIKGSENFILDTLDEVRPDIVTNSWGQDDGDIEWHEKSARRAWAPWAMQFRKLINEIGCVSFFAAGNDDRNDADDDVAFPQRIIPETANIIGSHNRSGKPSKFSGDGVGVQVTFWGERMMLLNQDGQWEVGSGTSFACPKAAGLCAYLKLSHYKWRQYVLAHATRPDQWSGYIPHPKWGYGSLEYRYQELLAELPDELQPPLPGRRKIAYMDMEKVR
jgi:hypothetical protein